MTYTLVSVSKASLLLIALLAACSGPGAVASLAPVAPASVTKAKPVPVAPRQAPERTVVEYVFPPPSSIAFAHLDADGDLLIAPSLRAPMSFGDAALNPSTLDPGFYAIKLKRDGSIRWSLQLSANTEGHASSVAVDGSGNIYLAGSFARELRVGETAVQSAGDRDAFILSLTTEGTLRWMNTLGGAARETALSLSLSEDANRVAIGGWAESTFTFLGTRYSGRGSARDGFVATYDLAGGPLWCKRIGGRGMEHVTAVAFDRDELAVAGYFTDKIELAADTLSSSGTYDMFLARYDASGNLAWHRKWGSPKRDYLNAMRILADGSIALAGNSEDDLALGGTTFPARGDWDTLLWKVGPLGGDQGAHRIGGIGSEWATHLSQDGPLKVFGVARGDVNLGFGDLPAGASEQAFAITIDDEFRIARGDRQSFAATFPTGTSEVVLGKTEMGTTLRY